MPRRTDEQIAREYIARQNSAAGKASAAKLTDEQRKARARRAARARWSKLADNVGSTSGHDTNDPTPTES